MPALHTPPVRQNQYGKSHNPAHATPAGYHTWKRFSLIRVRSPLLTESLLFSLPAGTEMFHFPAFPPRTLCVQMRVTQSPKSVVRGFPIRTSWDQRSVINSPRLIADSYVLLRLLMPRHPPCALKNLTTHKPANPQQRGPPVHDASSIRENHDHKRPGSFIRNCCKNTHPPTPKSRHHACSRCSRPLCSSQTTTPSTRPPTPTRVPVRTGSRNKRNTRTVSPCIAAKRSCCLRTQQCAKHNPHKPRPGTFPTPHTPKGARTAVLTPGHNRSGHAKQTFDSLIFHP